MKYLHDIAPNKLEKMVREAQTIQVLHKHDGSYFECGIDENGFYSKLKAPTKYYNVSDYPRLPWYNDFALAHYIMKNTDVLSKGDKKTFEIVSRKNPLVVFNDGYKVDLNIVCHDPNFNEEKLDKLGTCEFFDFYTPDGVAYELRERTFTFFINSIVSTVTDHRKEGEDRTDLPGMVGLFNLLKTLTWENYPIYDLLNINLNDKSTWVAPDKKTNSRLRDESRNWYKKYLITRLVSFRRMEGLVYSFDGDNYKIITYPNFKRHQKEVNFIKYYLHGDRRNAKKKSFIERTKEWPIDKQIERLNVLLNRFNDYVEYGSISSYYVQKYRQIFADTRLMLWAAQRFQKEHVE